MTKKLSSKRAKWVAQRKTATIKGTTLANPVAPAERYARDLKKLVARMTKITEREVQKLYQSPEGKAYFTTDASIASQSKKLINSLTAKFNDMFGRASALMSEKMVGDVNKASIVALGSSMKQLSGGMTVNTKVMSADLHETVKASIAANAQLIKSIPTEYLARVGGAVLRSVTTGQGMADLMTQVKKYGEMTDRRAKNVALDQTRKAYNSINADRMKKVGIKKFEWIHSMGGIKPREDHIEMDGNIYSFDDLPVVNKDTGERGLPGSQINCKCTMRPVVVFDEEEA